MLRLPFILRCPQELGSLRSTWRTLVTGSSFQSSSKNDGSDEAATDQLEQSEKTESSSQSDNTTVNQGAEDSKDVKKEAAKAKLASLLSSLQKNTQRYSNDAKRDVREKSPNKQHYAGHNMGHKTPQFFIELSRPRSNQQQAAKETLTEEQKELKEGYKSVGPQFAEAVKSVSEEVGGGTTTQSELLTSLKKWKMGETLTDSASASNMKDLLSTMTAEKRKPTWSDQHSASSDLLGTQRRDQDYTRPRQRNAFTDRLGTQGRQPMLTVGLFDAEPLNIFPVEPPAAEVGPASLLPTWDSLAARDLERCTTRPPANQYQEFIQWTNQGKIWTFPIDNEVGLQEEKSVPFHEHIFLERYIASWCSRTGPVAHFMELVCVGLSKNPHVSVQRKHQVLDWYMEYFEEKRSLLEELGAIRTNENKETVGEDAS